MDSARTIAHNLVLKMNHKPRYGHPELLTHKEAADLLEVDTKTIKAWLSYLSLYHSNGTLIEENHITLDGLAALKEFRGDEKRYHANHSVSPDIKAMSRAELGRYLGISGRDVSDILKNIEQVHPLEDFFTSQNRLTRLAISCILEFRAIGITEYALKCHVIAA